MFCRNCGTNLGDSTGPCPVCAQKEAEARAKAAAESAPVYTPPVYASAPQTPVSVETSEQKLRRAFSSSAFLLIIIFQAINVLTGIIAMFTPISFMGIELNVSVGNSLWSASVSFIFPLLIVIAGFIVWSRAKNTSVYFDGKGIGLASGTLKAIYIIGWIFVAIFIVVGILFLFLKDALVVLFEELFSGISYDIEAQLNGIVGLSYSAAPVSYDFDSGAVAGALTGMFCAVFFVVAVVYALFNFFCYRSLYKFAKSVRTVAQTGTGAIVKAGAARGWIMFFAIMNSIGLLGTIATAILGFMGVLVFVGAVSHVISLYIACAWIKNNFIPKPVPVNYAPPVYTGQ